MVIVMRRIFATWTLLLVAAAWAAAQFPGGLNLPNIEYNPVLLINPGVQKELKLSPTAAANVQSVFMSDAMKLLPAIQRGAGGNAMSPQQRTKTMFDGVARMQSRLAALLSPAQRLRLRQLTLQSIGPGSVLQPKVATQLGLSSAQKTRLTNAFAVANKALAVDMTSKHNTAQGWQNDMGRLAKVQAQAKAASNKALFATLTPAQQSKWKAMLGRPFAMSGFMGAGNIFQGMRG